MVILGHASVGAISGIAVHQAFHQQAPFMWVLLIALVIGVLSHYVTDWIPHGHFHINLGYPSTIANAAILVDFIGSVLLMLVLTWLAAGFAMVWSVVAVTVFGAVLPDVVEVLQNHKILPRWRWLKAHTRFHIKYLHWHNANGRPLPWRWIDVWQVAVAAIAVFVIFNY